MRLGQTTTGENDRKRLGGQGAHLTAKRAKRRASWGRQSAATVVDSSMDPRGRCGADRIGVGERGRGGHNGEGNHGESLVETVEVDVLAPARPDRRGRWHLHNHRRRQVAGGAVVLVVA
jgi:hypothetical protein